MELHRHVLDSDMVFVRHMLALQLGNCIGHGLPFPGMDTVQSRVLCFGFEGTTLGLAQRLEQQHEGLSIAEPGKHIALKEPVRAVRAHRRPLRRGPCQRRSEGRQRPPQRPNQYTKSARLQRVGGHGSYVGGAAAVYSQERPDRLGTLVELQTEKVRDIEGISMTALEFDSETCLFTPADVRATTRQAPHRGGGRGGAALLRKPHPLDGPHFFIGPVPFRPVAKAGEPTVPRTVMPPGCDWQGLRAVSGAHPQH